jgi:hypothetical protein
MGVTRSIMSIRHIRLPSDYQSLFPLAVGCIEVVELRHKARRLRRPVHTFHSFLRNIRSRVVHGSEGRPQERSCNVRGSQRIILLYHS